MFISRRDALCRATSCTGYPHPRRLPCWDVCPHACSFVQPSPATCMWAGARCLRPAQPQLPVPCPPLPRQARELPALEPYVRDFMPVAKRKVSCWGRLAPGQAVIEGWKAACVAPSCLRSRVGFCGCASRWVLPLGWHCWPNRCFVAAAAATSALPAQLSEIEAQPREQAAVPAAGAEQSHRPASPPAADLVCPPAPFTVFPCLHASCCSWRTAIMPTHLPTCSPTHSPTHACLLLYCTLPPHTASRWLLIFAPSSPLQLCTAGSGQPEARGHENGSSPASQLVPTLCLFCTPCPTQAHSPGVLLHLDAHWMSISPLPLHTVTSSPAPPWHTCPRCTAHPCPSPSSMRAD